MVINIQDDILKLHAAGLLERLLADKTTGRNIMWATDAYAEHGPDYGRDEPITPALITGEWSDIIKTRARKAMEQQSERTRQRGEVFTPLWVCGKMIDYADEMWFGRAAGFHRTDEQGHIRFTQKRPWQKYVQTTRMEITCGEAPFLVQRYDVETGEAIPVEERTGILDRKLRTVSENAADEAEWLVWSQKAVQATYGYEFQGDNLLIARVNLWMSMEEHFQHWRKSQGKRPRKLTKPEGRRLCEVVAWNLWQMDGLTGTIPYRKPEEIEQFNFLYLLDGLSEPEDKSQPLCRLYDWERDTSVEYASLKKESRDMKFDFIIGNPPYQDETVGEQKQFAPPIYDKFMDASYEVGDVVELIHPARFLFNAGGTPKEWNKKMLSDPHFRILFHEQNSSRVFANTDIKGGVVISYHNAKENYGALGTYTAFPELNTILNKVKDHPGFSSLNNIIANRGLYRFSKKAYAEHPAEMAKITDSRVGASSFERMPTLFTEDRPNDGGDYVQFLGLLKAKRVFRWFKRDYFKPVDSFEKYKVIIPSANGSGALGEVLSTPVIGQPVIGQPVIGHTETFMSIGSFITEEEANACYKYICSKFCRTMLGVLKITQHNSPEKWAFVPLQDFTPASDIDWSRPIPDIDRQLYAKYGLDEAEIEFIETHVKAME